MKQIFCLGLLIFSGVLHAEIKNESKYGVIDMQKIILTVEEGKNARQLLEQKIKNKEGEFKDKKKELDKLNEEWKQQVALLSEEARTRKQQEFQQKFMDLRNLEMEFQNQIKKEESQATQEIAVKVSKLAEVAAKNQNLDAVFEANSSGLMYLKNPVDLTPNLINQYNTAHPGGSKSASSGAGEKKNEIKSATKTEEKTQ